MKSDHMSVSLHAEVNTHDPTAARERASAGETLSQWWDHHNGKWRSGGAKHNNLLSVISAIHHPRADHHPLLLSRRLRVREDENSHTPAQSPVEYYVCT